MVHIHTTDLGTARTSHLAVSERDTMRCWHALHSMLLHHTLEPFADAVECETICEGVILIYDKMHIVMIY